MGRHGREEMGSQVELHHQKTVAYNRSVVPEQDSYLEEVLVYLALCLDAESRHLSEKEHKKAQALAPADLDHNSKPRGYQTVSIQFTMNHANVLYLSPSTKFLAYPSLDSVRGRHHA